MTVIETEKYEVSFIGVEGLSQDYTPALKTMLLFIQDYLLVNYHFSIVLYALFILVCDNYAYLIWKINFPIKWICLFFSL